MLIQSTFLGPLPVAVEFVLALLKKNNGMAITRGRTTNTVRAVLVERQATVSVLKKKSSFD